MDNTLQHFGVLGMRWGVKKASGPLTNPRKAAKSTSEDYKQTQKMQAKGTKSLSTKELRDLTQRLQLEKQYKDLNKSSISKGLDVVKGVTAAGTTVAALYGLTKTPMAQDIKRILQEASKKGFRKGIDYII